MSEPTRDCGTLLFRAEEQRQNPSEQTAYQTVFVRMGGLLILLMTVGRWMDILNVFVSLVGEMWCLVHAGIMLDICRQQVRLHEGCACMYPHPLPLL